MHLCYNYATAHALRKILPRGISTRGEQFRKEVDDEAERERREDEEEFGGCGFCQGNHQEMVEEGGQCGDKDQGLTSGQERGEEESEYDEERPVNVAPAPQPRTKGKTTRTKASKKRRRRRRRDNAVTQ